MKIKNKQDLGHYGELLAQKYLINQGYSVISTNWRCVSGEVDIIAWDPHSTKYVFCEIKTRRNLDFSHPLEAISPKKLGAMFSVANAWKNIYLSGHLHH